MLRNKGCRYPALACLLLVVCVGIGLAQDEFVYDAQGKRDPFISLITADGLLLKLDREENKSALSVEGIIYDKGGVSYVLVNGTVAKIGDQVGEYQVLRIEQKKVVFIKEGQTFEVIIEKEEK